MNELLDRALLLIICVVLCFFDSSYAFSVVPIIITVTLSALTIFFDRDIVRIFIFLSFCVLSFLQPQFTPYLPVILYDALLLPKWYLSVIALIPFAAQFGHSSGAFNALTLLFLGLSFLLNRRSALLSSIRSEYLELRDTSKELSIKLEKKNKDLLEKQDYEINLATLNERNRIAREIHDNVGHMLSRSLLQVGALLAINKEENVKEGLITVKDTLSQAMDSIRSSVHDLHDESIDLFAGVKDLVDHFSFCPVKLDYDIGQSPETKIRYAFISVVKEALANIIKHSDATSVKITLREHPAFYQLLIADNGRVKKYSEDNGIGLTNIQDRINSLNGIVHITTDNGFQIFISVPKKDTGVPDKQ